MRYSGYTNYSLEGTLSKETALWLNTKTLIGLTDKRGTAWHYRSELQGDQSNHYPGAIPIGHVIDRLFNFEVLEMPCYRHIPATAEEAHLDTALFGQPDPVRP